MKTYFAYLSGNFGRTHESIIPLFLLLMLLMSSLRAEDEKFKVMTTFTVIADIVKNVAGDAARVESLLNPMRKSTIIRPRRETFGEQGC